MSWKLDDDMKNKNTRDEDLDEHTRSDRQYRSRTHKPTCASSNEQNMTARFADVLSIIEARMQFLRQAKIILLAQKQRFTVIEHKRNCRPILPNTHHSSQSARSVRFATPAREKVSEGMH
jgi:hypothetical protein